MAKNYNDYIGKICVFTRGDTDRVFIDTLEAYNGHNIMPFTSKNHHFWPGAFKAEHSCLFEECELLEQIPSMCRPLYD